MARDDRATLAMTRIGLWAIAQRVVPLFIVLMSPISIARPAFAAPLDDVRMELSQAGADLIGKQAAYVEAVRGEKAAAAGDFAALGEAVQSPTIDQMRSQAIELERRENELSATYGPAYPALVEVHMRRIKLEADLRNEMKRRVASSRGDYEAAREREAALKDSLADLGKGADLDAPLVGPRPTQASRLDPAPAEQTAPPAATVPRQVAPTFLHDLLVVSVAVALFGLFVGLAVMLWRDVRGRRSDVQAPVAAPDVVPADTRRPLPVEPQPREPPEPEAERLRDAFILGRVPALSDFGGDLSLSVVDDPKTAFAREVERLAARLLPTSSGGHVVSLFPLRSGQGTTSLAICLAEAVARNGFKVLLIDADSEDRGLSRAQHAAGMRGLAEVLAGIVAASKLVLDQNGVAILPGGRLSLDLRADAEPLAALLAETRERFDLILIDAAPFDATAGSTALCRLSDDFGLVACRDDLPRDRFIATVEAAAAFPSFAGLILNRERTERSMRLAAAS